MINPINYVYNHMIFKYKKVSCKNFPTLVGKIIIKGAKGRISLGKDVVIHSTIFSNPTSGFNNTCFRVGPASCIHIGNNVGISNASLIAYSSEGITIDDDVFLGSGCKLWDTDFHPINYQDRISFKEPTTKPIHIKTGAFVGACTIVLKGVTIGSHSVVGAGSVVACDIPDNEIWAGNPAKYIRGV